MVQQFFIPVVPTEPRVAVDGFYMKHAVSQLQDGDVKGPAAQVPHQNGLNFFTVQSIGQCSGGGFINNPHDFQVPPGWLLHRWTGAEHR